MPKKQSERKPSEAKEARRLLNEERASANKARRAAGEPTPWEQAKAKAQERRRKAKIAKAKGSPAKAPAGAQDPPEAS